MSVRYIDFFSEAGKFCIFGLNDRWTPNNLCNVSILFYNLVFDFCFQIIMEILCYAGITNNCGLFYILTTVLAQ